MSIDTEHSSLPIEMLAKWAKEKPEKVYLRQPVNGDYHEYTWSETYDRVMRLAAGYAELGLQPGDKVVILSENCAEWFIADFALQAAGLVSVPIYFTAGEETISFVIEHSEAKAVIVGKLADYAAAEKAIPASLITIAMPYQTVSCQYQMRDLIERNDSKSAPSLADKDDMFSISYTSGSTGTPKGVVLTYRNIMYGALATVSLMEHDVEPRVLSYLPLAHITERA
ncbi:MAG: AMP-binding protein, partial [Arenicella sp.]|nr:AMP-binding protein [Arenicella sp.]